MHAVRQKLRPKHQVLILKCYPRTTKGAVDVKPNSSELSYLLYYATTRRSKVQKVGAFLEKKTASDVWRARIGSVQITLQIVAALIEKAPRDLPLYAPYVLKILSLILGSRDITMVESSIPTFEAFCENHDGASISADHDYLNQYDEIIRCYASFCSTKSLPIKPTPSPPVAVRWRNVGLRAIKSVASTEALASVVGRQLDIIVPVLLENLWANDEAFLATLDHRMQLEEKIDTEKLLRRRTSVATVRTAETGPDANPVALSGSTADADKLADEDIGVLAIQCLKQIFVVNNRAQIYGATKSLLKFINGKVEQNEKVIKLDPSTRKNHGWATRIFEMITRWTPVQDRYAILVTAMDHLVRSPLTENNIHQQLILATIVDSLLSSDINLIGLGVMDVLQGLIQHALRTLQLGGPPHLQQALSSSSSSPALSSDAEAVAVPSDNRKLLLDQLQRCIGDLATHVYYADQISDIVSAIILRLRPPSLAAFQTPAQLSENLPTPTTPVSTAPDTPEESNADGFFSFTTAKIMALESIKSILLVASRRKDMTGGGLGRNRVPIRVWEGTQWLLRDPDGRVRKTYVDVLLTWLDTEVTKADLRVFDDMPKPLTRSHHNDSSSNLSKRAASTAVPREKRSHKSTFLQLLHLAVYENALEFVTSESDMILLHLLLAALVDRLGVNAVKNGLPMIFRLQEAILEVETPLAKVRIGSLCHGYFWTLSETFDFDTSPVGAVVHAEIIRRRNKQLWVDKVRHPPVPLRQIGIPGEDAKPEDLPIQEVESEALLPFDDRFQMVTLIALAYADSISSSTAGSAPSSPAKGLGHSGLDDEEPSSEEDHKIPDAVKEQMMSEWTRESVIAVVQERSKTVSLNGSRSGTNTTGNHRNFLAVNGNAHGGTMSGSQSPTGAHHHSHTHRSRPNSTYGHASGLGSLPKIRKSAGNPPSPASESSRNSVTRVDQLKRLLLGQQSMPVSRSGLMHSDTSSDSMVSYDFTASEVSFNPAVAAQGGASIMERSVSQRVSRERSRSKSRERPPSVQVDHSNPLSSNPVLITESRVEEDLEDVPPVPPLPSTFANEGSIVSAVPITGDSSIRNGRSVKRAGIKSRGGQSSQSPTAWAEQHSSSPSIDLENLLKGIETGGSETGEGRHNREHFNNTASSYDTKFEKTINQLIREIQKRKDWINTNWVDDDYNDDESESKPAKGIRLLDYACGTGLVSRALAPYITQSIGIDISENMVAQYNLRATNQGLSSSEMSAYQGNLLLPNDTDPASLSGPEFYGFDVAAVGLGFHHFNDPPLATKRLAERLKSGGVLLIIDFMPHASGQGHSHEGDGRDARHTVTHYGFSEDQVKKMFVDAGVGKGFEYQVVGEGVVFVRGEGVDEMKRTVFMARGEKI
ncbi:hypothetical protein B7463_g1331, partial [Scytalidium lignicola]